ncbi:hypothetical protein AGDE_13567 [Angomonas deanei]|nr:hypothetical protein AGDE_13567 [Angomonas deanei]|eukprot:EPY22079.1 hypothetical protein AGDE_13567 [Angomonas deanei]
MSMVAPGAAGSPFGKSAFYNDETLRMSVYYNNNNDTELEERYRAAKEEELLRSKFSRDNSEGPNTFGEHGGNAISQMSDTLHSNTNNRKRKSDSTLVLEQFTNAIVSATNADSTSKSAESSPVDRPTTAPSRPAAGKKEVTFNFAGVNGK